MRFANDLHSWLRHSWKLLANRLTRDPKIVIHGNSCIILYTIIIIIAIIIFIIIGYSIFIVAADIPYSPDVPFTICDYGTADGGASIPILNACIGRLMKATQHEKLPTLRALCWIFQPSVDCLWHFNLPVRGGFTWKRTINMGPWCFHCC